MSETGGESSQQPIESIAQEGLELARTGDYAERFQDILHASRDGSHGMVPTPEGLVLKALYHQSRDQEGARSRQFGAIDEIRELYNGTLFANIRPQVTPVVVEALGLLLRRSSSLAEQASI